MSSMTRSFSYVLLTVALVVAAGCASTAHQRGTGEALDDSVVTVKVKAMLFDEPGLRSADVHVQTFKGTVQLTGFVNSRAQIERAVEVAQRVEGVQSVKNDMRLK